MSNINQQDFKPLIIHGKNAQKSRNISIANVHSKADVHHTNGMNAAALERKIDEGKMSVPQKIPANVSAMFRDARMAIKTAEGNSITQDVFAKQCCVPKVDSKFISMLEGGSLLLNHDNKMTVRNLQRKLKISHFDLP